MKALILAAGCGTRIRSVAHDRAKPMLPVGGRPLLEHSIELLRSHGVRDIAINVHHLAHTITSHFGNGQAFGVRITYSIEERLLGTAGAARRLSAFLDEPFYVLYGDVLTDVDLSWLAKRHRMRSAVLSMGLYTVDDPTRAGIAQVDDAGRVVRFLEKPTPAEVFSNLASTGILVVNPSVLRLVPEDESYDFAQHLIPRLLDSGAPVYGWPTDGYVLDIGSPERYSQAQADARAGRVRLQVTPAGTRAC